MRVRALAVVAALVGAAVAAVPTAAVAAPISPPYTALSVTNGASTSGVSGGAVTVSGDALKRSQGGGRTLNVGGTTRSGEAYLSVTAPGDRFVVGTFTVGSDPLVVRGRGSCVAGSGSVTVTDVAYAADGVTLASIGLDVTTQCNGVPFVASLRLNSATPFTGVDLGPGLPPTEFRLGGYRDVPVTLAATGSESLDAISGVTLLGADAALNQFHITDEDCTGRTLAPGQSCTATVRVLPQVAGNWAVKLGFLHDTDDTPYEALFSVQAVDTIRGTYYPVGGSRVLDTRKAVGHSGALKPGEAISLNTRGWTSQPASAVVLNLTVDRPTADGYLTAYPSGKPRPATSSINFPARWQGANLVTVPVGADGRIIVFNAAGATTTIADLVGYYAGVDLPASQAGRGGGYHPTSVERIFDTRASYWGRQLRPGEGVSIPVRYRNDVGNIGALAVTVTAANMRGSGYLTAISPYGDPSTTSTLNFFPSTKVISNAAIVPAAYVGDCDGCASIVVVNMSSAATDVVVDINGYFGNGNDVAQYRFQPLASPTRIIDTRVKLGTTRFGQNTTRTITSPTSVAGYNTIALDANITAVKPTKQTYVTVWPTFDDYPRPQAGVLNPVAGQVISDHAIAEVGYGNRFNLYNAAGDTDLVFDVSGTFEFFPPIPDDEVPPQQVAPTAVDAGRNIATTHPRTRAAG